MKYIITEEQNNSLKRYIHDYIESNFTPYNGWLFPKEYKTEIRYSSEVFFFLEESEGSGEDRHMYYSLCLYEKWDESKCPHLKIPKDAYDSLYEMFGDLWKSIFIEWFEENTKLKVKEVIPQDS